MSQSDLNHGDGEKKIWPPNQADFPDLVSIPEHKLIRCIGQGSYGQVWLARNAMGAYRAVKIVFRDSFDSERPFARELYGIRKFEPVSRLHEGFVDVLQVGLNEPKGYFYYIMEVGDDQATGQKIDPPSYVPNTLASEIARRGRLSLQECLQLGLALTHALAELQKHGLVHRDIKPGNVIFVDGVPKLADIGLVTSVDDTRSFVGTAGFIAPEGPGKPEADIYSLGMVLYEASTGKDRHEFPFLPTEWSNSPDYSGLLELNEVILQACKENPTERYRKAWDMHADLVVVLNGKSVKQLKQLERKMAQLKRFAGIAVIIFAVAGSLSYAAYRAKGAAREEHARKVAADVSFGNRAMETGDLLGALPFFAEALRLDQGNEKAQRNDRLRVGSILASCPKIIHMWFEPKEVRDAEFSSDYREVLIAQYYGNVKSYHTETEQVWAIPFGKNAGVRSAVFSPDGRFILITGEANQALVWDTGSRTQEFSLPHPDKVYTGRFSPDGSRIVTACKDGIVRVWNFQTRTNELSLPRQSGLVAFAGFSHNGKLIVTASHNGIARVWRADDGRPKTSPLGHPGWVKWAAFSPDDTKIVTAGEDHRARVWDVETGKRIHPDLMHAGPVESAEFSPDGRLIITASFDGTVKLWRASDLQPAGPCSTLHHGEAVTRATFSSDSRRILSACFDGTIRLWDLAGATMPPRAENRMYCRDGCRFVERTETRLQMFETPGDKPISSPFEPAPILEKVELTENGAFVLTSSIQTTPEKTNHVIQVWDSNTSQPFGQRVVVGESFTGAVVSRGGERIAVYGTNQVRIYEVRTGTPILTNLVASDTISSLLFNPGGDLIVTISGATAQIWNAQTGQRQYGAMAVPVSVSYAEFSPDGKFLVTCSSDNTLTKCSAQIWDVRTGRAVGEPLRHGDGVLSASFSHVGNLVATASEDSTAKVWDARTGAQLGLPLRHADQVKAAAWSLRAEWVATASIDQTARLWDPQTGDPLTPPLHHLVTLWDAKFLTDDSHLVCGSSSGLTFKWKLHVDPRPAADIVELAELLSGGDFISPVSPTKGPARTLNELWENLRIKYQQDFTTSQDDIVRWHEFQVDESASEEDWGATIFHLEHLLKLRPNDKSLRDRLATIQEQKKKQN
jgi:WD40 repeat protein